jgi:hypothetical protein
MTRREGCARLGGKRSGWVSLVAAAALAVPVPALAFKMKAHVVAANGALGQIVVQNGVAGVPVGTLGVLKLENPVLVEALRKFPDYYRAGALGPDAFPDLVTGQLTVHVNQGREYCETKPQLCKKSGDPFESRKLDQWRSIDHGMYMLKAALNFPPPAIAKLPGMHEKKLQAVAFAYGYLTHMAGDGFAHGYVNEWTRAPFSYTKGKGLYGPITEELQHLAVEGYLDAHLQIAPTELTIGVPVEFLNAVMMSTVQGSDGAPDPVGGEFYKQLLRMRQELASWESSKDWPAKLKGNAAVAASVALKVNTFAAKAASLGTDVGNPVRDVEDYIHRRRVMIDQLLASWVRMSGCVAQNLLHGAASPGPVTTDACAAIAFESTPEVKDIYEGALDKAARHGAGKSGFDFGAIGGNIEKIGSYVGTIAQRGLVFNPSEDIRSIRVIKDAVAKCDTRLVKWKSCDNACTNARQTCSKVVIKSVCLTCPTKNGKPSCDGWKRKAACGLEPHCFGCESDWGETIVNPACSATVESASPVCAFCSQNSICAHLDAARETAELTDKIIVQVIEPRIKAVAKDVGQALLKHYAGPYANDYIALFHELEKAKAQTTPAWAVNLAFLREDVRANPAHLQNVLARALGVATVTVDNSASVAQAAAGTAASTATAGTALLRTYIEVQSGVAYERVWEGFVRVLVSMARDPSFDVIRALHDPAYAWLDQFRFKSPAQEYDTRFARFVALASRLKLFSGIRGPTVQALRGEMGLPAGAVDAGVEGWIDVRKFHPVYDAVELSKLGFLGGPAIDALLKLAPEDPRPSASGSVICRQVRHILCDTVQSLDDPNNEGWHQEGPQASPGSLFPTPTTVDPDRSVAVWLPNDFTWTPGSVRQGECKIGLTDFCLASSVSRVRTIYDRIFMYPPVCSSAAASAGPTQPVVTGQTAPAQPAAARPTAAPASSTPASVPPPTVPAKSPATLGR